jgi:transposase-like protein
MHGPYPGELRTRVIDFVEEGGSRREAAEQFDVSVSSAIRWVQRFRENGTSEPMLFIDETAVTTTMLRLNGWNPRGERLVSDAPMGHWRR